MYLSRSCLYIIEWTNCRQIVVVFVALLLNTFLKGGNAMRCGNLEGEMDDFVLIMELILVRDSLLCNGEFI